MHLKLTPSKFNFIFFSRSKSFLSSLLPVMISDLTISLSSTIRFSGFLLDSSLSFNSQLLSVVFSCFFHIRRIRQISFYLDDASLKILVCSLALSRLDYCNSLYFNLFEPTFYPLTKAFNSAARLVSPKFSHISPSLVDLYWLPLHFCFSFKYFFTYIKFLILFHLPIFLTSYYLLNVLTYCPLLALSSSLSLPLILTLKLLFLFLVYFSGTFFLLISNLF